VAPPTELASSRIGNRSSVSGSAWLFSWPLLTGLFTYLCVYLFYHAKALLRDGDVYWHIAVGRWILQHRTVPSGDPFSHSMPGAAWTAHEWLAEVVLAAAHQWGGWTLVITTTSLAFAATIALLTRALLRYLEPIYALMFAALAIAMTVDHVLARPHVIAMPLMMIWTIELVRASDEGRSPSLWLLPIMILWANLHGGFTLGIALVIAFTVEALLVATKRLRLKAVARSWGAFLVLALACSMLTPHGPYGILFTWQVMVESSYALSQIGEWQSPNFHNLQAMEIWLLAGLALVMHQGLRLPPIRLVLVLGLLHLSLKHVRNIELLGLLAPLFVAAPFAAQWHQRQRAGQHLESADRIFHKLAQPAGQLAIAASLAVVLAVPVWGARVKPIELPEASVPALALNAVQEAGHKGPVLNNYNWGGYLIFSGIPVFIDGRADLYGDALFREYVEAMALRKPDSLQKLLDKYQVAWTLLEPGTAAVTLLDQLPGWRRFYSDKTAVVHVKGGPVNPAPPNGARALEHLPGDGSQK
jgi:hypothetical protein